jgi:hypothetical protein
MANEEVVKRDWLIFSESTRKVHRIHLCCLQEALTSYLNNLKLALAIGNMHMQEKSMENQENISLPYLLCHSIRNL